MCKAMEDIKAITDHDNMDLYTIMQNGNPASINTCSAAVCWGAPNSVERTKNLCGYVSLTERFSFR